MNKDLFEKLINNEIKLDNYIFEIGDRSAYFLLEKNDWIAKIFFDILFIGECLTATLSGCTIQNNRINDIFNHLYKKYYSDFTSGVPDILNSSKFIHLKDTRNTDIVTEFDLISVLPIWKNEIATKMIPFINNWLDLQKINDKIINQISPPDLPDYIPGETMFKKLIIMKFCKNENFTNYINKRIEVYKNSISNGKKENETRLKILLELKDILTNV